MAMDTAVTMVRLMEVIITVNSDDHLYNTKGRYMRILLLMFLAYGILFANMTTRYDGSYSFLKMSEATMTYDDDGQNYSIVVKIKATGPAKLFSSNRIETVESRGKIINGVLVPDSYAKIKNNDKTIYAQTYHFDHDTKKITLIVDTVDKVTDKKTQDKLDIRFYAKEDILSLYYNFRRFFKNNKEKTSLFTTAVGGRGQDGQVHISIPSGDRLEEAKDLIEGASQYYTFNVFTKIMGSENGEFYIGMKDEDTVKKIVLKDVVFFGDVIGTLVE